MAVYKVPQDVEADDKLIGPFSFRQFIYLIIVAIAIALGWGLSQLFIPLAIIPLPVVLFFGALALPLRKDQPMEIYLAAIVSFYLKPRKRLWQPDGIQSLVEITAPKTVEVQRTKEISQTEAQQRLSYLADIVDTGGWAIRGVATPDAPSPMKNDVYYEAQQTEDVLDDNGGVSRSFDTMISQADAKRRQEVIDRMRQPEPVQAPTLPLIADPYATLSTDPGPNPFLTPSAPVADQPHVNYNPYPNSMHQTVITPLSEQRQAPKKALEPAPVIPAPEPISLPTPESIVPPPAPLVQTPPPVTVSPPPIVPEVPVATSEKPASPDIINLANNSDLSIETIAHEAKRIHQREVEQQDEVVISLR